MPDHTPALKVARRVQRDLVATNFGDLVEHALHDFIDELEIQLQQVHYAIVEN